MQCGERIVSVNSMDDMFQRFIDALLRFFNTGVSCIDKSETLEITAIIEAGQKALADLDTWISVQQIKEA